MSTDDRMGKYFHFDNVFWSHPLKCGILDLYQIGELCCERGFRIEDHVQEVYEITYVISGSGFICNDGVRVRVGEGDVFVSAVGHRHAIDADPADILRFAYIGFRFNEAAQTPEFDSLRAFYEENPGSLSKDRNDIQFPFLRCMGELYSRTAYSAAMIRNYCESIIILASRDSIPGREAVLDRAICSNSVSSAVYAVIRYVEENLCSLESIQNIARDLGYNYTYLSHFFKDKTGITLQKYISYKKIEYALQLLKYGELGAAEIAARLRYESVNSFSKAFRRVMGMTPAQYLKKREEDGEGPGCPDYFSLS